MAYWSAGEGRLSEEAKEYWPRYVREQNTSSKRMFLYSVPPAVAAELLAVEHYRTIRRTQLARNFPELDVWLVEEALEKPGSEPYRPKTLAGRQTQARLVRKRYPKVGL